MNILHACIVLTVILIAFMTASREIRADERLDGDEPQTVVLSISVKPKLCLRFSAAEPCELEVHIQWHAERVTDYCVYSEQSEREPIKCWSGVREGKYSISMSLMEDTDFWLSYQGGKVKYLGEELARCRLELATIVKDVKSRRSNKRHIWNLI